MILNMIAPLSPTNIMGFNWAPKTTAIDISISEEELKLVIIRHILLYRKITKTKNHDLWLNLREMDFQLQEMKIKTQQKCQCS